MDISNIYSILSPIALILLALELIFCFIYRKNYFSFAEFIANTGTAILNQCMNLFVFWLVLVSYGKLTQFSLTTIDLNIWTFLALLLAVDFLFYWFHRWGHSINILWAAHSPHHSAEEMNLGVGLRASVTQRLLSFSMFWPLVLIGFKPADIYIASGVHLILGFWHHTRVITKLGWFEKYFNTPSHHRVHHGTQDKYLDKNFAEILIVWDKLFGTFQEEEEEVCYGILRHPNTWSPIGINFHFWGMLFKDMMETPKLWDKIRLWFMPLGWRPPGVSFREPVKGYDLKEQIKFPNRTPMKMNIYLVINLMAAISIMFPIINLKNELFAYERVILSFLLFVNIHSWSFLLDGKKNFYSRLFFVNMINLFFIFLFDHHQALVNNLTFIFSFNLIYLIIWKMKVSKAYFSQEARNFETN